jgi:tetrahydromethanopterin S-methyltransferase subunit G
MGRPTVRGGVGPFELDSTMDLEEQVVRLVEYINLVIKKFPSIEDRLDGLEKGVDEVSAEVSTMEQRTLAHIETQIANLSARVDMTQVLDLRWAILGLFITTIGLALSY